MEKRNILSVAVNLAKKELFENIAVKKFLSTAYELYDDPAGENFVGPLPGL